MEKDKGGSSTKPDFASAVDSYENSVVQSVLGDEKLYNSDDIELFNNELKELFVDEENLEIDKNMHQKGGIIEPKNTPTTDQLLDLKNSPTKKTSSPKSSYKMLVDSELASIKVRTGDIETIRKNLGLSRRKISQLLLVDPSAWTRWCSKDKDAPAYIYRSLEWYLLVQKKHPQLSHGFWMNFDSTHDFSKQFNDLDAKLNAKMDSKLSLLTNKASKTIFIALGIQAVIFIGLYLVTL
ncbi:MAG: hypothetical protein AB8E15_07110 [Bdellovibrionales bacterium]